MRLLVVEDEIHLLDIIRKRLQKEHYSVDACTDGQEALEYIEVTAYDAIVLDIMLPGISGLEILKNMRAAGNSTPVLLLTARDSIEDRVSGLDTGADDYLVKPFAFEELLARIRVMIRHKTAGEAFGEINVLEAADLKVDTKSHQVRRAGRLIELSSREYAVLEYMMRNQGTVLSRRNIEEHVWNYDYMGGSNMIDVYIRYLRKKLDDGFDQKLIHTVRGSGYVLRSDS
ncbi:response regulator transcription factor [Ruminococcus sp. OA3]|uniref:response regulator transcription factor n=1 Tax=Ruminococcus sp. OA3 TaxID=2914164 RepID=UPI001F05E947|nr:response regulator transcription factor [Ruminococcus sp. OA3]MCH1981819.1 response regulator transcription factor [Ruminococcus sp. OA3]